MRRRDVWWGTLAVILGWCVVSLAGCSSAESSTGSATADRSASRYAGSGPIEAVATTGMVAELIRNVGGDRVRVTQLCGAGVDPHLFKATRDDLCAVIRGDILFVSGLHLEGKLALVLKRLESKRPVIAVAERLPRERLVFPPDAAGAPDPHAWNDVSAWSEAAAIVAEALAEFDPQYAAHYATQAAVWRDRLARLHEYGREVVASIPAERRVLVTSHDAFHYFGRAYGVEVLAAQGLSTESEAGLARINALVDVLVERKIPAVFVESSVPAKSIEALVEGAAARGHRVTIGGELFSDAMGSAGTYEGTYEGMLDHNLTVVARALGGTAPPGGFGGRLGQSERVGPAERAGS